MRSHLNVYSSLDQPTLAESIVRHITRIDIAKQNPTIRLAKVRCLYSSANLKLAKESHQRDLDLRVVLGHIAVIENADVELRRIQNQTATLLSPPPYSKILPTGGRMLQAKTPQVALLHCPDRSTNARDANFRNTWKIEEDSSISDDNHNIEDDDNSDDEIEDYENDAEHALLRVPSHPPTIILVG